MHVHSAILKRHGTRPWITHNSGISTNLSSEHLVDEQPRHALPRPNAHARQQNLLLLPLALAQARANLPDPRRAQRMAQRDCSTPDVHLASIDAQRVHAVDGHGRKSFVELDNVDVREREVVFAQQLRYGEGRTDAHYPRRKTYDGGVDVLGQDGLVHLQRGGALHQEDRGGAVRDLAGIAAGGSIAVLGEGRAYFAEGLIRGAPSGTLVFRQCNLFLLAALRVFDRGGDGHNFVFEPARFLRSFGPLVGFGGETVLRFSGDVEIPADVLGCLTHGLHAVDCILALEDFFMEGLGIPITAWCGHHLGADGNAAIDISEADLVGNVLGRFKARGTEPVHGGGG